MDEYLLSFSIFRPLNKMSAVVKKFRTDVAVVGPIRSNDGSSASSAIGQFFAIGTPKDGAIIDLLLHHTDSVDATVNEYVFCKAGMHLYNEGLTSINDSGTGKYTVHYFRYSKSKIDPYLYVIAAYDKINTTSAPVGYLAVDSGKLILQDSSSNLLVKSAFPVTYPGMPNLLSGVPYFIFDLADTTMPIPTYPVETDGDEDVDSELPNTVATAPTDTESIMYFFPLSWYKSSACDNEVKAKSSNMVYHQCFRSSVYATETGKEYYTSVCGASNATGKSMVGHTSSSVCHAVDGKLYFYTDSTGKCGSDWPSDLSYTGLDNIAVRAEQAFGYSDTGYCAYVKSDDSGEADPGIGTVSPSNFTTSDDTGSDTTTTTTTTSIPWWIWVVLVLLALFSLFMVFMYIIRGHSKPQMKTVTTMPLNQQQTMMTPQTQVR